MISETKLTKHFNKDNSILKDLHLLTSLTKTDMMGILVYVRQYIPSNLIEMNSSVESIFVEINIMSKSGL